MFTDDSDTFIIEKNVHLLEKLYITTKYTTYFVLLLISIMIIVYLILIVIIIYY